MGYEIAESDRGLFIKKIKKGAASPNEEGDKLSEEFWNTLESKWPGIKHQTGPRYKHLSWDIIQDKQTGVILRSQSSYIKGVLRTELALAS